MKRAVLVTLEGATQAQAEAALGGVRMEAELRGCRTNVSRILGSPREHAYVVVIEEEEQTHGTRDTLPRL